MQDRPHARELLSEIAETLESEVLPATEGLVQHHVRVAASLCRILEREAALGAEIEAAQRARLQQLLASDTDDVASLTRSLDLVLAYGVDDGFARAAWESLVAITRDKLRVAKPGHDAYDFGPEVTQ